MINHLKETTKVNKLQHKSRPVSYTYIFSSMFWSYIQRTFLLYRVQSTILSYLFHVCRQLHTQWACLTFIKLSQPSSLNTLHKLGTTSIDESPSEMYDRNMYFWSSPWEKNISVLVPFFTFQFVSIKNRFGRKKMLNVSFPLTWPTWYPRSCTVIETLTWYIRTTEKCRWTKWRSTIRLRWRIRFINHQ